MTEKKFDFRNLKRPSGGQLILLAVGLLLAVALFIFMRGFVACWQLTSLPGSPPASCGIAAANLQATPGVNAEGTPLAPTSGAPEVQMPPPWDGASRVTILIIGLDYRDWLAAQESPEIQGPPRSDTMILLT
ncbi:MAG: hypothetical protein Q7U34_14060, partial [Anaerolineales bacterium]|nr:hypothetical protein [Anaerolineales bacterium]